MNPAELANAPSVRAAALGHSLGEKDDALQATELSSQADV